MAVADAKVPDITTVASPLALCRVRNWLTTGIPPLDAVLGGGIPVGRVTEIYGGESTGKTLLGENIIAACQHSGGLGFYGDAEAVLDATVLENVGVDIDRMLYHTPDRVEDVFETLRDLMDSRITGTLTGRIKECFGGLESAIAKELRTKLDGDCPIVYVWDSVAATSAKREQEGGIGEKHYAIQAGIISEEFRKQSRDYARAGIAFVCLNQIRDALGVMFGESVATFGGRAMKFYASIRMQLKLKAKVKDGGKVVGYDIGVTVTKNKLAPPFRTCRLPMTFGHGVLIPQSVLWFLQDAKVLEQAGAHYTLAMPGFEKIKFQAKTWNTIYADNTDAINEYLQQIVDAESMWGKVAPTDVESVVEGDD